MKWRSADGKAEASKLMNGLEVLVRGMLNRETLLDLVRHFIVFEKDSRKDDKTGQTTVTTVKKLAAYHQYYAVNAAVVSTLRAAGMNRSQDDGAEPLPSLALPPDQNRLGGRRLKGREHACLRQVPRSQGNPHF
jgi:type I restriction enzyme R subunit